MTLKWRNSELSNCISKLKHMRKRHNIVWSCTAWLKQQIYRDLFILFFRGKNTTSPHIWAQRVGRGRGLKATLPKNLEKRTLSPTPQPHPGPTIFREILDNSQPLPKAINNNYAVSAIETKLWEVFHNNMADLKTFEPTARGPQI